MSSKSFTIEFFQGPFGASASDSKVSTFLKKLNVEGCPVYPIGSYHYEIRDLSVVSNGAFYQGYIAKFRSDDLPHIAKPGGEERAIAMSQDEGLIEKNYFLFEKKHELLVYQGNRHGCTPKFLGEYLRMFSEKNIYFEPVLQIDPMRRLLARNVKPKKMELSFAKPGAVSLSSDLTGFSDATMQLLNSSGGARIHMTITPPRKSLLNMSVKDIYSYLIRELPKEVSVARIDVEDEGITYPIDLIADRLKARKFVKLEGKYPVPGEIYRALHEAQDEHANTIREIFQD